MEEVYILFIHIKYASGNMQVEDIYQVYEILVLCTLMKQLSHKKKKNLIPPKRMFLLEQVVSPRENN